MALIVEDGTGKADAESYISVTNAETYLSNRGKTVFSSLATTTLKEQALRKATDYIEGFYSLRWKGARVGSTQYLSFPRYNVILDDITGEFPLIVSYVPSDEIPAKLTYATAEIAEIIAGGEDVMPTATKDTKREKVGDIEVEYMSGASQYKTFTVADRLLNDYLEPSTHKAYR